MFETKYRCLQYVLVIVNINWLLWYYFDSGIQILVKESIYFYTQREWQ